MVAPQVSRAAEDSAKDFARRKYICANGQLVAVDHERERPLLLVAFD